MDWEKVDLESVAAAMPSELSSAYADWVSHNPDKAGRLEEIVVHLRTEFRDAINSHKANVLDPREDVLPVSAIRHCENLVWFTLCMEMGFPLSSAAVTAATAANLYLRQIAYGHYSFTSEDGSGVLVPSGVVPARKEYGTRTLAAILLLLFCWVAPARAEWGKGWQTVSITNVTADYTPQNYPITTATLYSHLQGIDTMLGMLSDTNGLYGRLVGLPQLVYDTLDTIQAHSLYGDYRPDADVWLCLSQTNVMFQGQVMAAQLRTRKDEILGHSGDLIVDGGIEFGGEYRTNWPSGGGGGGGDYLPAFEDGSVFEDLSFSYWVNDHYGTTFPSNLMVLGVFVACNGIYFGGEFRTNWPSVLSTARVSSTDTSVVAGDYLIWLDTRAFSSSDSVTLTLPDMDGDSQTIVVRRLGNDGTATIARGTNTWTLSYDGDGITIDWLGAATNWFWRSF